MSVDALPGTVRWLLRDWFNAENKFLYVELSTIVWD